MSNPLPQAPFPEKLAYLFEPWRYKVAHGGRGSAKSWSYAAALAILGACTDLRALCAREFQKSIQDSVHQLLSDQITRLGLGAYYQVLQYEIRGRQTDTSFIFEGLHANVTKIKSFEGLNIVWVEEAEKVTKPSWETLIPTLRTPWVLPWPFLPPGTALDPLEAELGGKLVDPEIWVTYNPDDETDETYQKFQVREPPPGARIVEVNWQDNPWFPEVLRQEKDFMYATDPDGAEHVWGGQCRKSSAAQILNGKYVVEYFEVLDHWTGPYNGTDWGFATDPLAHVRCWIDEQTRELYIEHEAYGFGVETDDTPEVLSRIPDSALYVNRADNARPETISYCRRHGHPLIVAADKWPGSVEDGISYLRQQFVRIVIHPRCIHTATEARLWSYKVDKNTQDVLPEVEDKNNHCWDAIRYALAPLIKGKVKFQGAWWRRWTPSSNLLSLVTVRWVTVSLDAVDEEAAEQRASFQQWGCLGAAGQLLLQSRVVFGPLPEVVSELRAFWSDLQDPNRPTAELWIDTKAVGDTLVTLLQQQGLPAQEWETEDRTVLDPDYRAKQAAIHLAAGRVFVPPGPQDVINEIEGVATNAMTLSLLIWQQRGGGVGPLPIPVK